MAQSVYVFVSSDPAIRGLSLSVTGRNIPQDEQLSFWPAGAVVPMTAEQVARYVPDPTIALQDLQVRGYHLFRTSAKVLPFSRSQPTPAADEAMLVAPA
jgi:hypothetical protein